MIDLSHVLAVAQASAPIEPPSLSLAMQWFQVIIGCGLLWTALRIATQIGRMLEQVDGHGAKIKDHETRIENLAGRTGELVTRIDPLERDYEMRIYGRPAPVPIRRVGPDD